MVKYKCVVNESSELCLGPLILPKKLLDSIIRSKSKLDNNAKNKYNNNYNCCQQALDKKHKGYIIYGI